MRRASEASLFFLGFPRIKKPLHNGSYENSFAKAIWWWMLLYISLRKVTRTNMRKNMYVVTPRCAAAAAVVSAVVLRRPTKEYTHPYLPLRTPRARATNIGRSSNLRLGVRAGSRRATEQRARDTTRGRKTKKCL